MRYDTDSHELFPVVAAIHHEGVCEALDDGALRFSESFHGVATCGVGDVDWGADLDVIAVDKCQYQSKSSLLLPPD